jgi:hypothetical protein
LAADKVAFLIEMVEGVCMGRREFLKVFRPSESENRSLPSAKCQMTVFGAIIDPAANLLLLSIALFGRRRLVGPEPVRHDRPW